MPGPRKAKPNVIITREVPNIALWPLLRKATVRVWDEELPPPHDSLLEELQKADGVLSMLTDRLDAATIAAAPRLRVISNLAVGVDNIDLRAATAQGIAVGHTPGVLTETTADLAFALLTAVARRIVEADRHVREGRWKAWGPGVMLGRDIYGATLGIIGWGAIGQAMARRAAGFGMHMLFTTRTRRKIRAAGAAQVELGQLLRRSDFVSIHVPLTAETHHILGAREFAVMKRSAILINTARGAVIDQKALADSLACGHLGGAGLDVTEVEPLDLADPLLKLPNVVITPHIGSASHQARRRMAEIAVDNILAVLQGKLPPFCANPGVKLRAVE